MSIAQVLTRTSKLERRERLLRATVVAIRGDGTIVVSGVPGGSEYPCDLLATSAAPGLPFESGDLVLVWSPEDDAERPVILGRVESACPPASESCDTPAELVLEAKDNLTLKCGEGSITIRADGKILIKGKDLVSRAQRTNRIKGGAVSIN